ncbi:MAG: toll/interleukin-1 receptor domain-containing protein, partial [Deltaproteobacteria bacterium]|nr:toll/interleukin-1 receptor domain-containing protein [Deltaproteobacteria bacterium]
MTQGEKSVFVSYVREDSDDVDRICGVFRKNGIAYWLDRDKIEPGKLWKQAIRDAIDNGAFFLACFSEQQQRREETYMNEELLLGVEILRRKPHNSGWLIPVKLSPCVIPQLDIGAGKTLQDIQYLNFYEDWGREIERLVDIIKREENTEHVENYKKYSESVYVYRGLKALIESGNGWGFHNADLGHPVYVMGASDTSPEMLRDLEYADSPQKSVFYKMLSGLSKELKKMGIEELHYIWWYDFSEWKD